MKRLLIISPYFPPYNAADMQRVRMSLPFFGDFGWEAEVVMVDEQFADISKDELLLQSVPADVSIHKVGAFDKKWTSKLGLGSIALRSLWFYKRYVDILLRQKNFDLVYFSTTQFPVCILGAHWKKKFGIPYVIDMQDPWHSEYYRDKPKNQRPKKYWFSYRLNKYLEPKAMKSVDGLISVSEAYINELKARYAEIKDIPSATITFGAFEQDMEIAAKNQFPELLNKDTINIVYVGRGGYDMHQAIKPLFKSFSEGLKREPALSKLRFYFIGTSYAAAGEGIPTISPLAAEFGLEDYVVEQTDRISYYHTLNILLQADALFIPGSDDPKYTASKIYPYLLTGKPLLAILNGQSPAIETLKAYGAPYAFAYEEVTGQQIGEFLTKISSEELKSAEYDKATIERYSAKTLTGKQCQFFDKVIDIKTKAR